MTSTGGHFAAAIFQGQEMKSHRTIHRYTTRRKQGGSQSTKDNQSSHSIKSAGSHIRRQNEVKLKEVGGVSMYWLRGEGNPTSDDGVEITDRSQRLDLRVCPRRSERQDSLL